MTGKINRRLRARLPWHYRNIIRTYKNQKSSIYRVTHVAEATSHIICNSLPFTWRRESTCIYTIGGPLMLFFWYLLATLLLPIMHRTRRFYIHFRVRWRVGVNARARDEYGERQFIISLQLGCYSSSSVGCSVKAMFAVDYYRHSMCVLRYSYI